MAYLKQNHVGGGSLLSGFMPFASLFTELGYSVGSMPKAEQACC